jgi:magnesium and cobalt transporter
LSSEDDSAKGIRSWLKLVFSRLAGLDRPENLEKEIQQLIDEGEQRGLITQDEGEMIQGIFSFRDTTVREIMVPRTDAVLAPVETDLKEVIDLIVESGHTRIPIFQSSVDNIVGILHAKDLLRYWGQSDIDLQEILRPPQFIPETQNVSVLLKNLLATKDHMVLVIDEYGGVSGIATLEDILEEIVGEIQDEYDAEENWIVPHNDGSILVDARLDKEDLEEYLDVELPDGHYESVGGLIISALGKVPSVQESVVVEDVELTVEVANSRKIEKVRVRRLEPNGTGNGSEYAEEKAS